MHRSVIHFSNLKLAFVMLLIASCTKYRTEDAEIPSIDLSELTDCTVNTLKVSTEDCLAKGPNHYIYSQEYGGRTTSQTNQIGLDGALTVVLPDGWYEGRTATIIDSDLQSSNITAAQNFFGISGNLTGGNFAACIAGVIDTHTANPSSCDLSSGNYVYDQDFGPRALMCPASGLVSTACWLSGTGYYLNSTTTANCVQTGLQSSKCRIPAATTEAPQYWYSTAFNGRGNNCTMPGTNGSACWTNSNNVYVLDATCSDGYNGGACVTPAAKYVYTGEYGGRDMSCTSNSAGSCYFTVAKNIAETNLSAGNIKNGFSIFGIAGTYNGLNTNWGSAIFRTSATTQFNINDEATTYSGVNSTLPAGYRAIPAIATDTEGGLLESTPQVTKVDRTGWGALTCGTTGTVSARIIDCAANGTIGPNSTWDGPTQGNSGQGVWKLVSRTGNITSGKGREVWKDMTTGLMWSSLISTGINWCKGVGNSNSANTNIVNQNLNENDPSDICDQIFYQNQVDSANVISGCSEFVGMTTTDPGIDNAGKADLNAQNTTANGKVLWRVPSIYDYMIANANGMRFVLPDMQTASLGAEWTATIYSVDRQMAFVVDAATGQRSVQTRSFLNNLRCVGR